MWPALQTGNATADVALLVEDFFGVHPTGFAARDGHVEELASGPIVESTTARRECSSTDASVRQACGRSNQVLDHCAVTTAAPSSTPRVTDARLGGAPSGAARQLRFLGCGIGRLGFPALRTDVRTAGHFRRLKRDHHQFTITVHGNYRAILRPDGDDRWTALEFTDRKEAYR